MESVASGCAEMYLSEPSIPSDSDPCMSFLASYEMSISKYHQENIIYFPVMSKTDTVLWILPPLLGPRKVHQQALRFPSDRNLWGSVSSAGCPGATCLTAQPFPGAGSEGCALGLCGCVSSTPFM